MYLLSKGIQCQLESAVGAGIVAQRSQGKPSAGGGVEDVLLEVGNNTVQKHLSGFADAAADDHHLGIDDRADVAQELTHVPVDLIENGKSLFVPGLARIKDVLAGHVFQSA